MKDDPVDIWSSEYSTKYEGANYGPGLAGWVMRSSHELIEMPFHAEAFFGQVVEVGAGSGVHFKSVRHQFAEYRMTDFSDQMLRQAQERASNPRVTVSVEDAAKLSFADASFDRLIATHLLEHLYRPHEVLREWARVVKPGGIISIVLPCDPGLAWRLGRYLGPRQRAKKNGLAYDYTMAREHVNSITGLIAMLRYYFDDRSEAWWPARIPFSDINLIYAVNIQT